jgi:hypothetical protein
MVACQDEHPEMNTYTAPQDVGFRVMPSGRGKAQPRALCAKFMQDPASELPRIPFLRTRVNSALEELEDGLVDRGVPFDS